MSILQDDFKAGKHRNDRDDKRCEGNVSARAQIEEGFFTLSLRPRRNKRRSPFSSSKTEDDLAWIKYIRIEITIWFEESFGLECLGVLVDFRVKQNCPVS